MKFSLHHELSAPVERIASAVSSPDFAAGLEAELRKAKTRIDSVTLESLEIDGDATVRVLRFSASTPLPFFRASEIARDALTWRERFRFSSQTLTASWDIVLDPRFARYFEASGTYRLDPLAAGRARRAVAGELAVRAPLMGSLIARAALADIEKTYAAERTFLNCITRASG